MDRAAEDEGVETVRPAEAPRRQPAKAAIGDLVWTHPLLRRHLVELARSIEEHKRTEDRLRTSEAFYQTLVETLPQNIFRKDEQGRFTFANRRFCNLIGKPLSEVLGKTDFDFFPQELAEKYQRDDRKVKETGKPYDTVEENKPPGATGKLPAD